MVYETIDEFVDSIRDVLENSSLRQPLEQCRLLVLQNVRDNFTSSVTPDGEAWQPRKVLGDGHPLLMDKGKLLQAATAGGQGGIAQIGDRELVMGVDGQWVPYAATQNYGRLPIPAREYYGASEETLQECDQLLLDGLMANLDGM